MVQAQVTAAEVRRDGPEELRNPEASYRWARMAAWFGDERGRTMLAEAHAAGIGDPADLERIVDTDKADAESVAERRKKRRQERAKRLNDMEQRIGELEQRVAQLEADKKANP